MSGDAADVLFSQYYRLLQASISTSACPPLTVSVLVWGRRDPNQWGPVSDAGHARALPVVYNDNDTDTECR